MLTRTIAAAVQGIDAIKVEIEVTVDYGAGFMVIGLPDTAVKESAERVRCAIRQTGNKFLGRKVMVNMSPADIKKEGSAYDLPLAIGILAADEKVRWIGSTATCSWENCRWMARYGPSRVSCPWPSWPGN